MDYKKIIIKLFKIEVHPVVNNIIQLKSTTSFLDRISGRTTKLADAYIQLLYEVGEVTVKDHYNSAQSSIMLRNIILNRLQMEHPGDRIEIQYSNERTLKLIK